MSLHRALTFVLLLAPSVPARAEALEDVAVERGVRTTASGSSVPYDLYRPVAESHLTAPPWPAVVLTHGFARSRRFHSGNARHLAERGLVVLVPDMVSLLGGSEARLLNVADTADHLRWLVERSALPGDSLQGLVDRSRLGLAGHSAGAAVSFEAAVELSSSATPVEALALLDGVPWRSAERAADDLPPVDFASFTSEPSSCNASGSVVALSEDLRFPNETVRIVGATHCDPESPTNVLCRAVCGGGSRQGQSLYRDLVLRFFQDAFGTTAPVPYRRVLDELAERGDVVVTEHGPEVAVSLFANGRRAGELAPGVRSVRVTADVFARPTGREATWFAGFRIDGKIYWSTPRGIRALPAPRARFEPAPLDDFPLFEAALPQDAETPLTVFAFALDGLRLLAWDGVTVSPSQRRR